MYVDNHVLEDRDLLLDPREGLRGRFSSYNNQRLRAALMVRGISEPILTYLRSFTDEADSSRTRVFLGVLSSVMAVVKMSRTEVAVRARNVISQVFDTRGFDAIKRFERFYGEASTFTIAGSATGMLPDLVGKVVIENIGASVRRACP